MTRAELTNLTEYFIEFLSRCAGVQLPIVPPTPRERELFAILTDDDKD